MNEPTEITAQDARAQAGQALLLARIFATVVTLICLVLAVMACSSAAKFGVMFAELGRDAELPMISEVATRHSGLLLVGMLLLAGVTVFFVWAKGKAAAWMAGLALLLLAVFVPVMVFAMILPLVKIISEMGSM